jgi:protein TonB
MINKYQGHIVGLIFAFLFFVILAYIVKPANEALKTENSFRVVDFIRLKKDSSLKEKSRTIPDKPEPPKKPPPPDLVTPELQAPPTLPNSNIEFPDIAIPTDMKGAFLGPQSAGGNSQLVPLVRINPQYPRNELLGGVEGWVKIQFVVTADGSVSSPNLQHHQEAHFSGIVDLFLPMELTVNYPQHFEVLKKHPSYQLV